MQYPITPEQIRINVQRRINEAEAELQALKGIKINTKLSTLTNRAVTGEGVRIGDYIGINKALYVSYKYDDSADGGSSTRYTSRDITAYTYTNPDGTEIGSEGYTRISRTLTPAELAEVVRDIIEGVALNIGDLRSEYRRAGSIAKKHNALADRINEYNDGVSYASKARI